MTSEAVFKITSELSGLETAFASGYDPAYVIDTAEVEACLPRQRDAWGWYTPANPNIQAMLVERGVWEGPRPMIAIDFGALEATSIQFGWNLRQLVWCVFTHEVGHHPPKYRPGKLWEDLPMTDEQLDRCRQVFAQAIEKPKPPQPWDRHEWQFVRRAIHLGSRAAMAGFEFPFHPYLCAGYRYGLSHVEDYVDALGGEIRQLAGQTIETVESISPPKEFQQLFAADVARWNKEHEDKQ